ncbi:piggyBac transposable element-derived protein 4-like isoform X3 [Xyrauchen texanus]|nr:piggyBac transposable element-derived protein 4-like isoform X3 [Xyrauchen texanus]
MWPCGSCFWIHCKIQCTKQPWGSGDMRISAGSYDLMTRGPGHYDWKQITWRHSDGMVYTGRQPGEEVQQNLGENIVQQLCSRIRQTGRNITMDNFFTSVPLAEKLLEKNLTIVGTLRQNKQDIPPVMKPSKLREKYSSEFGFNGNMTMVSYVPKKGKAVVLLSTMHDDKAVDDNSVSFKKKPEMIKYYNKTKGGVDTMDQMVRTYSCKQMPTPSSLHITLITWVV